MKKDGVSTALRVATLSITLPTKFCIFSMKSLKFKGGAEADISTSVLSCEGLCFKIADSFSIEPANAALEDDFLRSAFV